ncbi:MAG: type VI secretion system baseplate subunit TssE [Aquisalimonadaceae bacterium]
MPELLNRENLQPSLLDRLTDRARFVERLTIAYREDMLAGAGSSVADVRQMLASLGLRPVKADAEGAEDVWDNHPENRTFRNILALRPGPDTPPLESLLDVRARKLIPNTEESRDERLISSRRLRQLVLRDLAWLLNTGQLTSVTPLDDYPQVRGSVLNYGVPDLTGVSVADADIARLAEGIRLAIDCFEPRVRHITVTPIDGEGSGRNNTVSFVIEGELWGQPLPEQLYLHTELDLEDATVTVRESDDAATPRP